MMLLTGHPFPSVYIIRDAETQREFSVNINKIREFDKFTFIKNRIEPNIDESLDKNLGTIRDISYDQQNNFLNDPKQDAVDTTLESILKDADNRNNQSNNLPDPIIKVRNYRHLMGVTRQETKRATARLRMKETNSQPIF